jgi:hypothetical protein
MKRDAGYGEVINTKVRILASPCNPADIWSLQSRSITALLRFDGDETCKRENQKIVPTPVQRQNARIRQRAGIVYNKCPHDSGSRKPNKTQK